MSILLLLAIVPDAHAANRRWNNGTGTLVFNTPGNWVGGGTAPGVLDVAQFGNSAAPFQLSYTVSFNNNATNEALHIEDDLVTFDLNARIYMLTAATGMVIGNQTGGLSGQLTVTDGTVSSTTNIDVGAAANTSGTLIVGANGLISGSPNLNIGKLGAGTLTVQSGGDISSTGATTIGVGTGITGAATIIGDGTAGSATLVTGALNVGSTGNGTVNIQVGGLLHNNADAVVGAGSLFTGVGTGIVNVTGASSMWKSMGLLEVGDGGSGEVNITNGGKVMGADSVVGVIAGSSAEVNVNGPASLWDSSGALTIGALGPGTLNITNQGIVKNSDGIIGDAAVGPVRGVGTVSISGAGSQWNNTDELVVGNAGTGTLNIAGGAAAQSVLGYVGRLPGAVGHLTVDGIGSRWESSEVLKIGNSGMGTLEVTGGGRVLSQTGGAAADDAIGSQPEGTGVVTVDGVNSLWQSSGRVIVGDRGAGTLSITGGGAVQSVSGLVGNLSGGGEGHVTVDGDGSRWDNSAGLIVIAGTLEITGGGVVQNTQGIINGPVDAAGSVIVNGLGSRWHNSLNSTSLIVGLSSNGTTNSAATLEIQDGGQVTTNGNAVIGLNLGSVGVVTVASNVAGADSILDIGGGLEISDDVVPPEMGGGGSLHIQTGGSVNVAQGITVSRGQFSSLLILEGGTLSTPEIRFRNGATANSNFEWTSGTLHVGHFFGDLVNQAGVLAPGPSFGLTQIQGHYNQLANATLEIELGGTAINAHDAVLAFGNVFLGGDLELALVNGFIPSPTDSITILASSALNVFNAFDNVANGQRLSTTNGLGSFVVNYGAGSPFDPDAVVLSNFLTGAIFAEADFDEDGDVDVDDLVKWKVGFGAASAATHMQGDADGDLDVDGRDFLVWQRQLGGGPLQTAASALVPEPTTAVLLILVAAGLGARQNRTAKSQQLINT